jgi:hypothetical protein
MSDTRIGISFHEVMSGNVTRGETDPSAGESAAHASPLVMRGQITIDDIDRFVEDPDHVGRLDVRYDWSPFGIDLEASGGVFNLFSPSDDPNTRLMVYEWPAKHDGRSYYFAGQKHVTHHPVRDVWKDTTTLYTALHEGTDPLGPVVGAGIIKLSVPQLIHMVGTFRAVDSSSAEDSMRAITKFGRFFLGELWDIYEHHHRAGA